MPCKCDKCICEKKTPRKFNKNNNNKQNNSSKKKNLLTTSSMSESIVPSWLRLSNKLHSRFCQICMLSTLYIRHFFWSRIYITTYIFFLSFIPPPLHNRFFLLCCKPFHFSFFFIVASRFHQMN